MGAINNICSNQAAIWVLEISCTESPVASTLHKSPASPESSQPHTKSGPIQSNWGVQTCHLRIAAGHSFVGSQAFSNRATLQPSNTCLRHAVNRFFSGAPVGPKIVSLSQIDLPFVMLPLLCSEVTRIPREPVVQGRGQINDRLQRPLDLFIRDPGQHGVATWN